MTLFSNFNYGVLKLKIFSGFQGVYKGLTPTILKQGSNQAMRFFIMETAKEFYRGDDKNKKIPTYVVGAFGALAGK